ncbi:MAG: hypothetical protein SGPRY_001178 [Prymnesium sp.]
MLLAIASLPSSQAKQSELNTSRTTQPTDSSTRMVVSSKLPAWPLSIATCANEKGGDRVAWESVQYEKLFLLGRSVSFTVDLSSIGCGCNAAVYLVQMTNPTRSGSNYCDIQAMVNRGKFVKVDPIHKPEGTEAACFEIDLIEGNKKAIQATLHTTQGKGTDGRFDISQTTSKHGTKTYSLLDPDIAGNFEETQSIPGGDRERTYSALSAGLVLAESDCANTEENRDHMSEKPVDAGSNEHADDHIDSQDVHFGSIPVSFEMRKLSDSNQSSSTTQDGAKEKNRQQKRLRRQNMGMLSGSSHTYRAQIGGGERRCSVHDQLYLDS